MQKDFQHSLARGLLIVNISNCIKKVFSVAFLFSQLFFFTEIHTQEIPLPPGINIEDLGNLSPEQMKELQAFLEENRAAFEKDRSSQFAKYVDGMVTRFIRHIQQTEEILQDLSLSVINNAIATEDKEETLQEIKNLRILINNVKTNAFVNVDLQTLNHLAFFSEALIEHISEAIEDNLEELPPFDEKLEKLTKRLTLVDFEKLEQKILENEEDILELKKDAHEMGLTWYNKSARKLNNLLVIAHRNRWDSLFLLAGFSSVMLLDIIMNHTDIGKSEKFLAIERAAKLDFESQQVVGQAQVLKRDAACIAYEKACDETLEDYNFSWIDLIKPWKWTSVLRHQILGGATFRTDRGDLATGSVYLPEIMDALEDAARGADRRKIIDNQLTAGDCYIKSCYTFYGKTRKATRAAYGVLLGSYFPIIKFCYGPKWYQNVKAWAGKKVSIVYGKLLGGVIAQQAKKAQRDAGSVLEPKYTFDDVVGLDHIKKTLNKVLEYIKDPDRFDRANIQPERGYLFTGLPGTGKSFVAEAFGGEIRKVFKEIGRHEDELGFYSFRADFINERGIDYLLDLAKKESPCVIFIDEIDLLKLQRGNGNNALLSEFLASMSGVLSKEAGKQVILLAATNRPEHLDSALRRRGRFGKIIHFEMPTVEERKKYFIKRLCPLLPDLSIIDLDKFARETEGCTYEELAAMLNSAFQSTKIEGTPLTQEHLEDALNIEIRNMVHKSMHISEKEQEMIAAHQAGRALALELLHPRRQLAAVTIKPITADLENESVYAQYYEKRKQQDMVYGKTFTMCPTDHLDYLKLEEKIIECKKHLAGIAAEKILLGSCAYSYNANAKNQALNIVKTFVFEGIPVKDMPEKQKEDFWEKAYEYVKDYEKEIENLLSEYKEALIEIAQKLQKEKTLSAKRIQSIIEATCKTQPEESKIAKELVEDSYSATTGDKFL